MAASPTRPMSPMPNLSLLYCLRHATVADLSERFQQLVLAGDAIAGANKVLVGYGKPDATSSALRDVVQAFPRTRALIHTRPCPASQALACGVGLTNTVWVAAIPEKPGTGKEAELLRSMFELARVGPESLACVYAGEGSPVLFRASAFARLPHIPGMPSLLPELFRCSGQLCWRLADTDRAGLSAGRLLRRLVVSSLCAWTALRGRRAAGTAA